MKLEWSMLTPLKPSLTTNHLNCGTAKLGLPRTRPYADGRDSERTAL